MHSSIVSALLKYFNPDEDAPPPKSIPARTSFGFTHAPDLVTTDKKHRFYKGYKPNFESRVNLAAFLDPRSDEKTRLMASDFPKITDTRDPMFGKDVPCWFGPRQTAMKYSAESESQLRFKTLREMHSAGGNDIVLFQYPVQKGYLFEFKPKKNLTFLKLSSTKTYEYLKELKERYPLYKKDSYEEEMSQLDKVVNMQKEKLMRTSRADTDLYFAYWLCTIVNREANLVLKIREIFPNPNLKLFSEIRTKLNDHISTDGITNKQLKFAIQHAKSEGFAAIDGFFWEGTAEFHEEYMICQPNACLEYSSHTGGEWMPEKQVKGVPTMKEFYATHKTLHEATPQDFKDKHPHNWVSKVSF